VLQKYDTNQTGLLELPEFSRFIRALGAHPAGGGGADLNRALQMELPHLRDGSPSQLRSRDRGAAEGRSAEGRRRGADDAEHVRELEDEVRQLQEQLARLSGGGQYTGGGYGGGGDGVSQNMVRDVIRSVASELVGSMPRQMARTAPAGARHAAQARGDPALPVLGRGGVNPGASLDASEERLYDDVMRARDATASRQSRHLNAALQQDRAHAAQGGVRVVDRRTGQSKGEVLKGRFPWQRELENFPSR
jgi:hypothetical protein